MIWHTHHLLPKHAGGTDDPSNLVKVNVAMHAFLHRLRYQETGDLFDLASANFLSGQISKEEARILAMREGLKRSEKAKSAARKNWQQYNASEEAKASQRKGAALQPLEGKIKGGEATGRLPYWNNGIKNKRSLTCPGEGYKLGKLPHGPLPKIECPHCGEQISSNKLNQHLKRFH